MRGLMPWIDARFPLTKMWEEHLLKYYTPKNFNFWYYFGSLALLVLVIQIVTGVFLTMHYKPDAKLAFASVEYIMRDVPWGWLIRYMHSTGASAFFIVVYLHMYRALMYGSYKNPRELIWLFGMVIYMVLMAEAFMGYLLPWGQMSFWGAQVIVNLFGAIPIIGTELAEWIRGDFVVSDATLTRFFALHVSALPLALIMLVGGHILALHEVGSNNPDGVEIKKTKGKDNIPVDGIPFHPYYSVKDTVGVAAFLLLFAAVIFYMPEMGGYFLEHANFVPADPLVTPEHIAPVWYFTPFYTVLRAVPDPFWGVTAMGSALIALFFLPWIDRNPIKSLRYRSLLHKLNLWIFAAVFLILGWLGTQPATKAELVEMAVRFSEVYFLFFFVLWLHSRHRSKAFYFGAFAVLLGVMAFYDWTRFTAGNAELVFGALLIPVAYLALMLLAPMFTSLNTEHPEPGRVSVP
jgi:ubiquinol-cytochrome c reductase cytochrome b subunit